MGGSVVKFRYMNTLASKKRGVRVSPMQAKLAEIVVEESVKKRGRSKKDMMLEAGYSLHSARADANRAFTSEGFKHALAELGGTQEKIAKVFLDAMQAKVVSVYRGEAHETDVPDHKTRLAAADKLGDFTGQKSINIKQQAVHLHASVGELDGMLGLT